MAHLEHLSDDLLDRVARGFHYAPHDVLGAHISDDTIIYRAIRHLATEVIFHVNGEQIPATHEHGGVWVAKTTGDAVHGYEVEARYPDGGVHRAYDPYQFLPTLGEVDLHLIGEGRHEFLWEVLGAHYRTMAATGGGPEVSGTSFSVWAPNARAVQVIGDFNGWDGAGAAMRTLGSSGVWEVFLPDVSPGALYKFNVCYTDGSWNAKADPMARATEVPPATASIVTSSTYQWQDQEWMQEREETNPHTGPMSVYEVHLGSWRPGLGYEELATALRDYVADLGFTHVELLPVAEHPYGPSWGYQVTSYYAPTSRFGTPDEFRFLVDTLHQAGIGVILDWVPAHFPKDSWALAQFDGTALYEHPDPFRGEHADWGTLIFDFGRPEVKNFLVANALYWLDEFHIDGLRVDAVASMLYLDYSRQPGQWRPNVRGGRENLEAIAFLQETNATAYRSHPGIIMMAEESTAWPGVTAPTSVGGLGFGLKWNMGWMNDTLRYLAESPINRRYHHGELTFSLVYAFSEQFILPLSHDEVVHGKGSILQKMPGDRWQQLAGVRALYAYQWTHPGKKLLFMGSEFAQEHEWAESQSLQWDVADSPEHAGIMTLISDLNRLYVAEPALWEDDFSQSGFTWLVSGDGDHNVIAYLRHGKSSSVAVVINFAGTAHENYQLPFPNDGVWREVLNTDAPVYGGSGVGNLGQVQADAGAHLGFDNSAFVQLPALGAVIFSQEHGLSELEER